jgi:hypothetical protein
MDVRCTLGRAVLSSILKAGSRSIGRTNPMIQLPRLRTKKKVRLRGFQPSRALYLGRKHSAGVPPAAVHANRFTRVRTTSIEAADQRDIEYCKRVQLTAAAFDGPVGDFL